MSDYIIKNKDITMNNDGRFGIYDSGWSNPVTPRKGFRQPKTSKHARQKQGRK